MLFEAAGNMNDYHLNGEKGSPLAEDGVTPQSRMNGKKESPFSKGKMTRLKILTAARSLFVTVPFRAAGIRMIAQAAGIRHPLVLHYFGSKEALFDEVVALLEKEILSGPPLFFEQMQTLSLEERISFFIEGVIRHGFQNPDGYKLIMLNGGDVKFMATALPGVNRIKTVMDKILEIARKFYLRDVPLKEANIYITTFTLAVSHYVGSQDFHQRVLRIESDDEYQAWVIETLRMIFHPMIRSLIQKQMVALPLQAGCLNEGIARLEKNRLRQVAREAESFNRGEKTRHQMIQAAKTIFSKNAYDSATIRMIGEAGNFDYSRIHHFFATKADLFEAVIKELFDRFVREIEAWPQDFTGDSPDDLFIYYLRRGLACCFANQETLGLVIRNIANYERFAHLKGFVHMARIHSKMLDMVYKSFQSDKRFPALSQWLYTIVMAGYSFAGAPDYPAHFMGLDPVSPAYRQEIFEALFLVFRPSLIDMVEKLRVEPPLSEKGKKNQ